MDLTLVAEIRERDSLDFNPYQIFDSVSNTPRWNWEIEDEFSGESWWEPMQNLLEPVENPSHKYCEVCGETKPSRDFGRSFMEPDGLHRVCRLCIKGINKDKYIGRTEAQKIIIKERLKEVRYDGITRASWLQKRHNNRINPKTGVKYGTERSRMRNERHPHYTQLRNTLQRLGISQSNAFGKKRYKDIVGYTRQDFIEQIMSQRFDGSQLDHKLAVSWFVRNDIIDPETGKYDVKLIQSLKNLQWLSPRENQQKKDRWYCYDGMTEWEWCNMLQMAVYGELKYFPKDVDSNG